MYLAIFLISLLQMLDSKVAYGKDKGLAIVQKIDQKNAGWKGEISKLELVLFDASGKETATRTLELRIREGAKGEEDRSLIEFLSPKDVLGTMLLTWSHRSKPNDQWLYLPMLRKSKRIRASGQGGSFMDSEFSYEDVAGNAIEKYTYRFMKDTKLKGRKVWQIERTPTDKDSGYHRLITWYDKEYLAIVKNIYFDRKNEPYKMAELGSFKQVGKYWRAHQTVMKNRKTKRKSIFRVLDTKLYQELNEASFSPNRMANAR